MQSAELCAHLSDRWRRSSLVTLGSLSWASGSNATNCSYYSMLMTFDTKDRIRLKAFTRKTKIPALAEQIIRKCKVSPCNSQPR